MSVKKTSAKKVAAKKPAAKRVAAERPVDPRPIRTNAAGRPRRPRWWYILEYYLSYRACVFAAPKVLAHASLYRTFDETWDALLPTRHGLEWLRWLINDLRRDVYPYDKTRKEINKYKSEMKKRLLAWDLRKERPSWEWDRARLWNPTYPHHETLLAQKLTALKLRDERRAKRAAAKAGDRRRTVATA